MTKKPPMTDYEKQLLLDQDNVHVVNLKPFDEDPFEYTKGLLVAICGITGKSVPSDDEIRKIVEQAKKES